MATLQQPFPNNRVVPPGWRGPKRGRRPFIPVSSNAQLGRVNWAVYVPAMWAARSDGRHQRTSIERGRHARRNGRALRLGRMGSTGPCFPRSRRGVGPTRARFARWRGSHSGAPNSPAGPGSWSPPPPPPNWEYASWRQDPDAWAQGPSDQGGRSDSGSYDQAGASTSGGRGAPSDNPYGAGWGPDDSAGWGAAGAAGAAGAGGAWGYGQGSGYGGGPGYGSGSGYGGGPGYGSGSGYGGGPGYGSGSGGRPGGPSGSGTWQYNWPGRSPQPHRTLPGAVTALLLVVAIIVGLGIGHGVWRNTVPGGNASNSFGNSGNSGNAGGLGQNPSGSGNGAGSGSSGSGGSGSGGASSGTVSAIAAKVSPALVDVDTTVGTPTNQTGEAAGTGIVLSSNGLVLTNNHVISGSTSIKATDVGNRKTYVAEVVGYDRTHDVALIQLKNATGLQTAKLGDSTGVSLGDTVVGLGNAGGLGGSPSVAAGQVTALNQSITAQDESTGASEQLNGLIQTDADIQPGDSGGALVNSSAQVVGVNTAASAGFSFQTQEGQGFAIPINQAVTIAHEIQSGHNSSTVHIGPTAFLGVYLNNPTSSNGGSGGTGGSSGREDPAGRRYPAPAWSA